MRAIRQEKYAFFALCALALGLSAGCMTSGGTDVDKSGGTYRVTANSMLLNNYIRVTERSTR